MIGNFGKCMLKIKNWMLIYAIQNPGHKFLLDLLTDELVQR